MLTPADRTRVLSRRQADASGWMSLVWESISDPRRPPRALHELPVCRSAKPCTAATWNGRLDGAGATKPPASGSAYPRLTARAASPHELEAGGASVSSTSTSSELKTGTRTRNGRRHADIAGERRRSTRSLTNSPASSARATPPKPGRCYASSSLSCASTAAAKSCPPTASPHPRFARRTVQWAILDSNQGPLPYQRSALTN
jgi:hypothetical protein